MIVFSPSLSRGDIFTPLQSAQDTRTITTIMAGEEETETFAFQAEINQLLSLIINVRSGTCFVCDVPLPESASYILSFPAQIFSSGHERFFSRLFVCAMTLTRFSPSLTLAYTDVLLEQRDLFARIDQVRLYVCVFFFRKQQTKERSESFVDATVRRSFPDRRRIGLSLF